MRGLLAHLVPGVGLGREGAAGVVGAAGSSGVVVPGVAGCVSHKPPAERQQPPLRLPILRRHAAPAAAWPTSSNTPYHSR